MLRIAGNAEIPDQSLRVALEVAIRVLAVPQLRRFLHQDATLHELDRTSHNQAVQKDGRLVHEGVSVGILQHHDSTNGITFGRPIDVMHVTAKLNRPDAPVGIEFEHDGILDQGFSGHAFDTKSRNHLKGLESLFGRKGWGGRNLNPLPHLFGLERFVDREGLLPITDSAF